MVYRVRHVHLNTLHAIKILMAPSSAVQKRLMQEGRVQASLRHPNVVSVTDIAMFDGTAALVMEYIEGPPLNELLKTREMNLIQAIALGEGILQGVAAAHDHGLIHRDLKPANVMLAVESGAIIPKVTDFGLAKLSDQERNGDVTATKTGIAMGTPAYMAPEQFRDAKSVDQRADVFSIGAILYELLCGARAFKGGSFLDVYQQVAEGNFIPIAEHNPDIPMEMQVAIERALSVHPKERHEDCHELLTQWKAASRIILQRMKEKGKTELQPWDDDLMNTVSVLSSSEDITGAIGPLDKKSIPSTSLDTWTDVDAKPEPQNDTPAGEVSTNTPIRGAILTVSLAAFIIMSAVIGWTVLEQKTGVTSKAVVEVQENIPNAAPTPADLASKSDPQLEPTETDRTSNSASESQKANDTTQRKATERRPRPPKQPTRRETSVGEVTKPQTESGSDVAPATEAGLTTESTSRDSIAMKAELPEKEDEPSTVPLENVSVSGDAKRVWLVNEGGTFGPGIVPVGTYKIKVLFAGKEPLEVGEVTVKNDAKYMITCQSLFSKCKVR